MKKALSIFIILCAALSAKSQNWGGGIDQQDFNWGFNFQYVLSEYKIIKIPNWREPFYNTDPQQGDLGPVTSPLTGIKSKPSVGFGIGFVVNYKLLKNLDTRSTPSLVFVDRLVDYYYDDGSTKEQKVSPVMVDLPLSIKLKSERRRDFRAYVLLGLKHSIDLSAGKKPKDEGAVWKERLLKNVESYSSYEAAIGFDLYFEYFKMSPEIKVSHSFGNVIKREGHPYDTPIDRAILRNFTFSLFFE
jgi:hypothetical protein